jgi:hypothetical protein
MVAAFLIRVKIPLKDIREEKNPEDGEQDEKLHQDDPPQPPSPGHVPETFVVEQKHPFDHGAGFNLSVKMNGVKFVFQN